MARWGFLGLVALVVFAFLAPAGAADGTGVIEGRVINDTAAGRAADGLEVFLRVIGAQGEGDPLRTTTDGTGAFRFEGLGTEQVTSYFAYVTYQGVGYSHSMASFGPGQDRMTIDIPIYETTMDSEGISVERAHLILTPMGSDLSVTELYVFSNPGDRTFVGNREISGRRWVSEFLLPKDARELAFDDGALGGRFQAIDGGFVDHEPLWPGRTNVVFSYVVSCPSGECDLGRRVSHRVTSLNVLVPNQGILVQSKRLAPGDAVETQGRDYISFSAEGLVPGEELGLRVRLQVTPSEPRDVAPIARLSLPWIITLSLAALLVLVYPFWLRHVRQSGLAESGADSSDSGDIQ